MRAAVSAAPDILQFSCQIYYVQEGEPYVTISLMRLGSMRGRISAKYYTEDGSATSGREYQGTSGVAVLEDGQYSKAIKVIIREEDRWAPTLEFKVFLTEPEGCELGRYLFMCRVKIFTDDTFPTNKYKAEIGKGSDGIESISGSALFMEYLKLNFGCDGMRWRTVLTIIVDQFDNLYLFATLSAKTYLVNVVFKKNTQPSDVFLQDKKLCASMIGLCYVVPMLLIHLWDYTKISMDIQGRSQLFLQKCLFRKYLNYSDESRRMVPPANMQCALLEETADLAAAYSAVLDMMQMLGKIALMVFFMLIHDSSSTWVLIVMPGMMLVFGYCRSNALSQASEFAGPLKELLISLVSETCEKYSLVADYAQRPQVNENFAKRADEMRVSLIPEGQVLLNNNYFPKWLGPGFVGVYITLYSPLVLSDDLSLGVFLAMISIFGDVSGYFGDIYKHVMTINTHIDSLRSLVKYFNLPTELPACKALNQRRQELTNEARRLVRAEPSPPPESGLVKTDLIDITLVGVSFSYGAMQLLSDVNLRVPQGKLVALLGAHGSGKSTFLRLLAYKIFPLEGEIFVPTHLRILFVSQEPVLLRRTVRENLTFGRGGLVEDEVVRTILQELRMQKVLDLMDRENRAAGKARNRGHAIKADGRSVSRSDSRGSTRVLPGGYKIVQEGSISDSDAYDDEDDGVPQRYCSCLAEAESEEVELPSDAWQESLTYTDKVKIGLARALIMNPEVLVLHRPVHHYDVASAMEVLEVICRHQKNRGLGLPEKAINVRRPRTVFFSPETADQGKKANVLWQIDSRRKTIVEVDKYQITDNFEPEEERRPTWHRPAWLDH